MLMTTQTAALPRSAVAITRTPDAARLKIGLGKDAVRYAGNGEWARACDANRAILRRHPDDCEAANRLAKALMEMGELEEARRVLLALCQQFPGNNIARRNLARLQKLEVSAGAPAPRPPSAAGGRADPAGSFIEEGGKSCATTLRRRPDTADVTAQVSAGDALTLCAEASGVAVAAADGQRCGSIEPRLARRLRQLMTGGNRYSAIAVHADDEELSLIIRETYRHPALRNIVSFPAAVRTAVAPGPLANETPPPAADNGFDDLVNALEIGAGEPSDFMPDDDSEAAAVAALSGDIDDDADGDAAADSIPVLDTDDTETQLLPVFVPTDDEAEWE